MDEQVFHKKVDALFFKIEEYLETIEIDFETQQNILTIPSTNSAIVLSKHVSLQEIWLASSLGAYHFRFTSNGWISTQNQPLMLVLKQTIETQLEMLLPHFPLT